MPITSSSAPNIYSFLMGYCTQAEMLLECYEEQLTSKQGNLAETKKYLEQALKLLENYSRIFPIGLAASKLYNGWYLILQNKPEQARTLWKECIAISEKMETNYEKARAYFELGRRFQAGDARQNLQTARDLFEQCGAMYMAQKARDLLA